MDAKYRYEPKFGKMGMRGVLMCIALSVSACGNSATRYDVEQLAASGPYNDSQLATALCGKTVSMLGGPDPTSPLTALPRAELLSWSATTKTDGAATVRLVGTAIGKKWPDVITLGKCEGVISFKYRFTWADNGRAIVKESSFTEGPSVVEVSR